MSNTKRDTELDYRITCLEGSVKRWRWLTIVMAVLLCGGGLAGLKSQDSKILRAERFEVVDPNGILRMTIGTANTHAPHIVMYDMDEKSRMNLGLNLIGTPMLYQFDKEGTLRMRVGLDEIGNPEIAQLDSDKKFRMVLDLGSQGAPRFAQFDKEQKSRMQLSLSEGGMPHLRMKDNDDETRLHMGLFTNAVSIGLNDEWGRLRVGMSIIDDEPSFVKFD